MHASVAIIPATEAFCRTIMRGIIRYNTRDNLAMSVPPFEDFMLPLLQHVGKHGESSTVDYYRALAEYFSLSESELEELVPSGGEALYKNQARWAANYLVAAKLLDRPRRGVLRITALGREVLNDSPKRLDSDYLKRFESFQNFREGSGIATPQANSTTPAPTLLPRPHIDESSPEEQLHKSHLQLKKVLESELLAAVKATSPAFFEQLVVELLVRMGYGGSLDDAGRAIGKSGDGGIDGIIKEDRLGLDFVYIQAKRWENVVGRPQIQGFAGSLEGQRARKGVFITTSSFTDGARDYVQRIEKRIVLIDGTELASLMLDYGLGVTDVATYKVQRIDPAYFGEE
jgi:restriction system protein